MDTQGVLLVPFPLVLLSLYNSQTYDASMWDLNKLARLIMIGTCPNCEAQVVSRYPFEIGICHCKNPAVEVPLQLAILPAPRIQKALQRVSQLSGVPFDKLVNAMLEEAGKAVLEGRMTIQYKI